jgi:hypothetical protein
LITAHDMARPGYAPAPPVFAAPGVAAPGTAAGFRERLLLIVLYVAMLASSVAVIEPSPHDGLMIVLAVVCLIAGVRIDRLLAALFILLLAFNFGGLLSLLNVPGKELTVQYAATSVYLAVACLTFACLFADNTMQRLAAMRSGYVLSAVVAAILGASGYLGAFPHAEELFAITGRAQGLFKDPNVFGPYLIWPALIVMERMFVRRIRLLDLLVVSILLFGLLLSFSRGAWFHFAVSCAAMIALATIAAPSTSVRYRIIGMTAIGLAALAVFIAVALSIDSIGAMFHERFHLVNSYDVGQGGRFRLQELAVGAVLNFPNGMGPFEFSRVHGLQQHNVYLQAFLVYGWVGGVSYLVLLAATLIAGLRAVFVATPWQPYLITTIAAFVGEVLEGFVIDTDHWRHFFLILGAIWGLTAATSRYLRRQDLPSQVWPGHVRYA